MPSASSVELRHIADALGLSQLEKTQTIQSLWSGYGELYRVACPGAQEKSHIVKSVHLPKVASHPRGWSGERGHNRKVKSYQVETTWYRHYVPKFIADCPMPEAHYLEQNEQGFLLVLTDLDEVGFNQRPRSLSGRDLRPYLSWLAKFHARGLNAEVDGLWDPGSYWHLETRPEELEAIADKRLKRLAPTIDQRLRQATYQTIIHGDAKLANFCVDEPNQRVAMVDFQYVGRGCGIQDVAYFLSSALSPSECAARESEALKIYFEELSEALDTHATAVQVIEEWRDLYKWAWADFVRFLAGWAPSHYKLDRYSLDLTNEVLEELEPTFQRT